MEFACALDDFIVKSEKTNLSITTNSISPEASRPVGKTDSSSVSDNLPSEACLSETDSPAKKKFVNDSSRLLYSWHNSSGEYTLSTGATRVTWNCEGHGCVAAIIATRDPTIFFVKLTWKHEMWADFRKTKKWPNGVEIVFKDDHSHPPTKSLENINKSRQLTSDEDDYINRSRQNNVSPKQIAKELTHQTGAPFSTSKVSEI
jgi:hypothetical protein